MIKKTFGIVVITFLTSLQGYGQKASFTQYFLNLPAINPAFTGFDPFLDVKTSYRQPWNNFTEQNGSFFLGAYGAIGNISPDVFRNNAPRISNPKLYGKLARSRSLRRWHGLGGMIMSNQVGPFKSLSIDFNYAYHLPLTRELSLSMGTKLTFINYEMDFQDLTVRDHPDPFYEQIFNSAEGKQQQLVGDFGITFYTDKFYLGFSSANLIRGPLGKDELLKLTADKGLEVLTGTQVALNPQLELYPGLRVMYSDLYGMSWEANVRVRYNNLIYLGAVYENKIKSALLLGLTFDSRYNINYSYDYFMNDLKDFSRGNHEFTLGMAIFNKYSRQPRLW